MIISTLESTKCGETPEIPNGEVTTTQSVYGPGRFVRITCKEGYQAQVGRLTCIQGEWDSNGRSPETICTRESSSVSFYQILGHAM